MNLITQINTYINKNNIDIAFVIVVIGLVLSTVFDYSWIISIIACLFMKKDESEKNLEEAIIKCLKKSRNILKIKET